MWCIGLFVAYCFVSAPSAGAGAFCQIAQPIYWSTRDSRATKAAVDRHNRTWKAVCGAR